MQRFLDIFVSGVALLVLAPLLLPVALVLRFSGEREVFYLQERIGLGGRRFGLLKFATMLKNSPNMGTGTLTVARDPRILPVGRFLRKTKINELPQLLNVLLGDMSMVGPRPMTPDRFAAYTPEVQEMLKRVRPGLTGIGSIVFRDEEEILHSHTDHVAFYNRVIAPYKGALEEWFVRRQGVVVYVKILFMTLWVLASPRSSVAWKIFPDLPRPPSELPIG